MYHGRTIIVFTMVCSCYLLYCEKL